MVSFFGQPVINNKRIEWIQYIDHIKNGHSLICLNMNYNVVGNARFALFKKRLEINSNLFKQ